ncbi:DeoR/GlpR family DNA-binding transcription regulator [Mycobacterium sp. ITM-2016-00317]|uniref:DeoR/GlpR family DNA-binding transcription regulator n=1 Tax=Mycobacterium sp. ITM-2016-00317 TaxID=2099694 RepID=UPI00287F6F1F|nr:DeoR/GlpR family DNA-binding transcription regulator [Mycobacterium sp. ITM-2016-00317]WNG87668.1 DeoR/GlpR family DNA-binding transcription regulator [Mycobacterium sp. ITM-2016-00317]
MLAATRRERIVELVSARRSISSDELAEALGVSVETVRRDLRTLDETRQLQRVRGGAIHAEVRTSNKEPSFTDRTILAADAKNAIGESAAQLLVGANTVFVDIGTTAIAVARAMLGSFTGTVITPSMWVAEVLSSGSDIDVFMPGGKVRGGDMSISGSTARAFLRDVNPDVAFLGTGGIDIGAGLTDFELQEVDIKRTVLQNSQRSYALADSSKFMTRAPFKVCDLSELTGIITDPDLPSDTLDSFVAGGVEILTGL